MFITAAPSRPTAIKVRGLERSHQGPLISLATAYMALNKERISPISDLEVLSCFIRAGSAAEMFLRTM
ncbi:MAG: hypothetical protein BWY83_03425 [bacterium ADurb.Bin478]|nr:MAG: hypothetical protein BWY83_03425 [bacterium ADurb.Bin478]